MYNLADRKGAIIKPTQKKGNELEQGQTKKGRKPLFQNT
jgi:hypothetical protein